MKIVWLNIKRNLHGIYHIILFCIPIIAILAYALIFKISQEASDNTEKVFKDCRVGIVDLDDSKITTQIIDHLEDNYTISVINKEQAVQNLIKNKINYIVTFPEGMSKDIMDASKDVEVKTISFMGSTMFTFFEEDLNNCINKYTIAGRVTDTEEDMNAFLSHMKDNSVKVDIVTPLKVTKSIGGGQYIFWGFVIFFMIYYNCYFGTKFFEDKKNNLISRVANTKYNYGQYMASLVFGALLINLVQILIISIILGLIVKLNSYEVTAGIAIILFLAGLVGLALGLFISTVSRSKSMFLALVSIIINVIAMLGGLYWPVTYMPNFMVTVAKFTPTYWLKESMDKVLDKITIYQSFDLYIVFLFVIVIFSATLLYHKYNFIKNKVS
jgi:ABC-2 type transport system permease protein